MALSAKTAARQTSNESKDIEQPTKALLMQGTSAPTRAAINDVDVGADVLNGLKVVAWFTNACVRNCGEKIGL